MLSSSTLALTAATICPGSSLAVAPVNEPDLAGARRSLSAVSYEMKRRSLPKPRPIFRPVLNRDFAVLLMRSSYSTLDNFDIVGMDQFQRDFFLIRAQGYEEYSRLAPNSQGELSDPSYFDYISFAQYTTIARCLSKPSKIITEEQPILPGDADFDEGSNVTQFRRAVLPMRADLEGKDLFEAHSRAVGETILTFFEDTYGGTQGAIPDGPLIIDAVKQLCRLFTIQGYAVSAVASQSGDTVSVDWEGSCVDWGLDCFQSERFDNDFLTKTIESLFLKRGVKFRRAKRRSHHLEWIL